MLEQKKIKKQNDLSKFFQNFFCCVQNEQENIIPQQKENKDLGATNIIQEKILKKYSSHAQLEKQRQSVNLIKKSQIKSPFSSHIKKSLCSKSQLSGNQQQNCINYKITPENKQKLVDFLNNKVEITNKGFKSLINKYNQTPFLMQNGNCTIVLKIAQKQFNMKLKDCKLCVIQNPTNQINCFQEFKQNQDQQQNLTPIKIFKECEFNKPEVPIFSMHQRQHDYLIEQKMAQLICSNIPNNLTIIDGYSKLGIKAINFSMQNNFVISFESSIQNIKMAKLQHEKSLFNSQIDFINENFLDQKNLRGDLVYLNFQLNEIIFNQPNLDIDNLTVFDLLSPDLFQNLVHAFKISENVIFELPGCVEVEDINCLLNEVMQELENNSLGSIKRFSAEVEFVLIDSLINRIIVYFGEVSSLTVQDETQVIISHIIKASFQDSTIENRIPFIVTTIEDFGMFGICKLITNMSQIQSESATNFQKFITELHNINYLETDLYINRPNSPPNSKFNRNNNYEFNQVRKISNSDLKVNPKSRLFSGSICTDQQLLNKFHSKYSYPKDSDNTTFQGNKWNEPDINNLQMYTLESTDECLISQPQSQTTPQRLAQDINNQFSGNSDYYNK